MFAGGNDSSRERVIEERAGSPKSSTKSNTTYKVSFAPFNFSTTTQEKESFSPTKKKREREREKEKDQFHGNIEVIAKPSEHPRQLFLFSFWHYSLSFIANSHTTHLPQDDSFSTPHISDTSTAPTLISTSCSDSSLCAATTIGKLDGNIEKRTKWRMVDILSGRKLFINQLIAITVRIYSGASLDRATSATVSINAIVSSSERKSSVRSRVEKERRKNCEEFSYIRRI